MTQPNNTDDKKYTKFEVSVDTNDNAGLKKYAKIVLTIAGIAGLLVGGFNALTVYQVSHAIGGSGIGLVFQAFFAFVLSFFVGAFAATVFCIVITVFAIVLFAIFGKKSGPGSGTGTGTPDQR